MWNSVRLKEPLMFEVLHLGSFSFFFFYYNRASKNRFNEAKVGKQGILSANITFTGAISFLQSALAFCSITNPCRVLE